MSNEYKIRLGIDLDKAQLNSVKQSIDNISKDRDININIDFNIKDASKLVQVGKDIDDIKAKLKDLNNVGSIGKGKSLISVDAKSVEASLDKINKQIKTLQNSFGKVDNNKGTQSLLTTVNKIRKALEEVSGEFANLNKNLSTLSNKNFSLNFDLGFGNGKKSSEQILSEFKMLKKEAEEYEKYFYRHYQIGRNANVDPIYKLVSEHTPDKRIYMQQLKGMMVTGEPSEKQLAAYREYINLIKEAADISGHRFAVDNVVKNALGESEDFIKAKNEISEAEKKLKELFSGGIDTSRLNEQLDSIVDSLKDIKIVIQELSSNISVDGLTTPFNRLSEALEKVVNNAKLVQNVLGNGFDTNVIGGNTNYKTSTSTRKRVTNQGELDSYLKYWNIKGKDAELLKGKFKAFSEVSSRGVNDELYKTSLNDLITTIKQLGSVSKQADLDMENLLADLRTRNIDAPKDIYGAEFGDDWKSTRARYTSILANKNSATRIPVDTAYEELKEQYPAFFPEDIWNPQDQLKKIFEVYDLANKMSKNRQVGISEEYNDADLKAEVLDIVENLQERTRLEQQAAQSSTQATNTIVDNERRTQQEYEQTLLQQKQRVEEIDKSMEDIANHMNQPDVDMSDLQNYMDNIDTLEKEKTEILANIEQIENALKTFETADVTSDTSGFDKLENDLEETVIEASKAEDVFENMRKQLSNMNFSDSDIDSIIRDIEKLGIVIDRITLSDNGNISIKGKNDLKEAVTYSMKLGDNMEELKVTNKTITHSFEKIANAAEKVRNKFKGASLNPDIVGSSAFDKEIVNVEAKANKLTKTSLALDVAMDNLKTSFKELKIAIANGDNEEIVAANEKYEESLKSVNNQLDINIQKEKQAAANRKLENDRNTFKTDIDAYLKKYSAAAEKYGNKLLELKAKAESCNKVELDNLIAEFKQLDREIDAAGLKTQTFADRIRNQVRKYSAYFSVAEVFMYTTQALRDMFDQVVAIDTAMTELKKVTDESDYAYDRFLTNAASKAKELGTTIDGLVTSTADFARLGYEFKDAQGLAEVANIYAVVGDDIDSVETATQSLISTLTAFKDEAGNLGHSDFALSIVDKMNEVSNNFAISSGGIGEALQRSASSMMAANNSLDETIALITAANTVVQDPASVGTAFKTISMRIRGAKTELEEAGLETEGMVESTATLRKEIMALSGVDIMANENEFKSTYQIMEELADKWQDLSDIQQATITELIAGKRQGNIVSSLMNNFKIADEALKTSLNSSGSAMAEHEKWQQSLEARLLKLKAAWQSLAQSFMSSDFLKVAIDGVISLVEALNWLIDTFGTLPTLLGVFAGGMSIFNNNGIFNFDKETQSIKILGDSFADLRKRYSSTIGEINKYNASSISSQEKMRAKWAESSTSFGKYISGLNDAKASMSGYVGSVIKATVKTAALRAITIAANAALTAGVSFLISAGISAITKWINAEKELSEKVGEVTAKYKEKHKALKDIEGDYDTSNENSMISRYEELSKGVNELGENVSLTVSEYSEYRDIIGKIASQIPSLITGYNSQGDAILGCKGDVDELTKAYQNLIKAENDAVLSESGKIQEDFENAIEDRSETNLTGSEVTIQAVKGLETMLNGVYSEDDITSYIDKNFSSDEMPRTQLKNILVDAGFEDTVGWFGSIDEFIADAIEEDPERVRSAINAYQEELSKEIEGMQSIVQAKLSNAFDIDDSEYAGMSDKMQSLITQIASNFDFNFYSGLIEDGININDYINDMLDGFNNLSEADSAQIEASFDLKTRFNNGEISYGEYVDQIKNTENLITGLEGIDDEIKNQIKLTLNTEEVTKDYDALKERLTSDDYNIKMKSEDAKKFLDNLTASEYAVAVKLIEDGDVDFSKFKSIEDLRKYIENEAKISEALNFNAKIEVDKTSLEALNTALEESASAMGLSEESIDSLKSKYADLEGYNPHILFEKTANGVKVNREELAKLEQKYQDLTKTEVQEHLDTLVEEYNKCTKAIDGNIDSNEKLKLIYERERYAAQIEELAEYQAQLEGVTGAYQRWIDAQNATENYEGYAGIATSREDVEDEISRGFIGNATKEYIDLLSGEDLVGGTIDEYAEAWERLDNKVGSTSYSIHDFFTVNDDGDITATGIDRFFEGMKKDFEGSVAEFNEETGKWQYNFSQENLQKIQDEWGIGIEAIELMLEAAESAGYDIDWGGIFDDLDIDMSNFESVEAMISLAEEAQEEFNKLKDVEDIELNFRTNNIEEATAEVEKARNAYVDLITNDDGTINLKAEGAEQMRFMLSTLITQKQYLSTPAIMKVDTSQIDEAETDIIEVINKAKELQTAYENYEIAIATGIDVEGAKKDLNSAIDGMSGTSVDVRADLKLPTNEELQLAKNSIGDIEVGATLDGTAISNLTTKIQTECTPEVIAKVTGLDESVVASESHQVVYTAEHKDVDNFINSLSDISKKIIYSYTTEGKKPDPSNIRRTITYEYKTEGESPAIGTAHASGTSGRAFARGNWGIKGNGVALGGELGQELVVRDGKFFTIGDKGAEFFNYRQNDIVFNAAQTESLFKYGGIKGAKPRGTMLAGGTAFAGGNAYVTGRAFSWKATGSESGFASDRKEGTSNTFNYNNCNIYNNDTTTSSSTSSKSSGSSSSSDKEEKEFKEKIDWIEVAIDRLERAIDSLDKKATNVYKSWSSRNEALVDEIGLVNDEISLQQSAYEEYMEEANSVGLSEDWAEKVRNGEIDIETITDEDLKEKIEEYQSLYEKALDCQEAIENLTITEAELYAQRFENVQSEYEGILQGFEHTENMINEYISQAEERGYIVSQQYYQSLIDNELANIDELKKEQAELIAKRDEAVASGAIEEGSEEWINMSNDIDEVTQAIEESTTAVIEFNNAIRDIDWQVFDLVQQRISEVTEEADFFIDLMSNKKLFEDDGKMTSEGVATMGLHAQNYNTYMYQADEYGAEIASLDEQIAADPYNQTLIDRRNEVLGLQRESILAAEEEKNAIVNMVEEGINLELDALQERIDKYNEALDSQKDLYEYQKKVKKQTEEIASLEKQIASYSGDDSEEAKAKVQELKVSLEDAETELQETEYDKYISDQQALLDSLYTEYELILNQRLDNIDALLTQVIDSINTVAGVDGVIMSALGSEGAISIAIGDSATSIKTTLETAATNVGTTLSTAMSNIWTTDGTGTNSVLATYGQGFQDKQTTTNAVLNDIKVGVNTMVAEINKEAETQVSQNKTTTSAQSNPTTSSGSTGSSSNTSTSSSSSSGDGNPKVGDKVKFVSGQYYYDSYGTNPAGSYKQGEYVYITHINKSGTHPYHISTGNKLGSGDLGWLELSQISGYATGNQNFTDDEIAWTQENGQEFIVRPSDGAILTPIARGDSVLNTEASNNIWNMANSPSEFIKSNLGLGESGVPNNSTTQTSYTQNLDNVVFSFPNVKNYDEFISEMQKDKNFERLIQSMTTDRLVGGSSLAKNKSIR